MNGKRYLFDTNAFIQLLSGNGSVRTIIDDADFLSTSVICQAEFLAYPKLDPETRNAFLQFLSRIHVYDVLSSDDALMRETVSMRVESGLKLPDAFIAATALVNGCSVISNDEHFQRQSKVEVKTQTRAPIPRAEYGTHYRYGSLSSCRDRPDRRIPYRLWSPHPCRWSPCA